MYLLCAVILFAALHIADTVFNIATGHDAPPPFTVCPECPPGNFQLIDFVPKMFLPLDWVFHWFFTYMGMNSDFGSFFIMFILFPIIFAILLFYPFAWWYEL